jgi:hypothetical protein
MSPKRTTPAQISEASIAADEDYLSNWMARLPEKKKLAPLSQLAVPGTHDSFTYSLSKDFPVGPGQFFPEDFTVQAPIFIRFCILVNKPGYVKSYLHYGVNRSKLGPF